MHSCWDKNRTTWKVIKWWTFGGLCFPFLWEDYVAKHLTPLSNLSQTLFCCDVFHRLRELIEKHDPLLSHFYPPGKTPSSCCKPPEPPLVKPRGWPPGQDPIRLCDAPVSAHVLRVKLKCSEWRPRLFSHPSETAATNLLLHFSFLFLKEAISQRAGWLPVSVHH